MTTECLQCGDEFERLGTHWAMSSDCEYPTLTQKQREITTGLLMGDGRICRQEFRNPVISLEMITKEYLQYVDEKFGVLGTGVSITRTAEESAEQMRNINFRANAEAKNYSDVYGWYSRTNPEFEEFADWYSTGKKVWPEDIKLTPTVLKHWYCGDGHWDNSGTNNYIQISMSNELKNTDKVDKLFENAGLPSPNNYRICERKDGTLKCDARFTVSQSKELWEYMGNPLPGFEYKWPKDFK